VNNTDWLFKLSIGKGVRFPTVSELFQGSLAGSVIVNNDPNLKAERSIAKEFSIEKDYAFEVTSAHLRASLFEDDVRDSIYTQTDITVFPNIKNIQNIDRVRTRGIEFSLAATDVAIKGLNLTGSLTFSRAVILENVRNPTLVGNSWVRIPRMRANLLAAYRPTAQWSTSLGMRHVGRQYNTLENTDVNPDTYGGTSSYTVWDAKAAYKISEQVEVSLGIDNLGDRKYFVSHPYPGRSFVGELRASF
jgi:iron complex outermembrane receptor protein